MSFIVTAAESAEHTRELPLNPYAIGAISLIVLMIMLLGVLSMGKGRDYN